VLVERRAVSYPHVWYAGHWPDALPVTSDGVFCELATRTGGATWFLPRPPGGGRVLAPAVRLARDCALLEAPRALFPN
jgi:hypothetical protein